MTPEQLKKGKEIEQGQKEVRSLVEKYEKRFNGKTLSEEIHIYSDPVNEVLVTAFLKAKAMLEQELKDL